MKETKPRLILKRYRSILVASMIVELVTFIVSLTDSVIAGQRVGMEALSSIGLMSPFFSISSFIAAVINAGTMKNYSLEIGRFQKKRATAFFSQGVFLAAGSGIMLLLVSIIIKPLFMAQVPQTGAIAQYLSDYYNIIIFYFLFFPISCLLDNAVIMDGGERFSAALNIAQIVGNISLSYFLAGSYGVKGIAIATVACQAGFVCLILSWFFRKKATIKLVRHFTKADLLAIVKCGAARASTFAFTALMLLILNNYVLRHFDSKVFCAWAVDQKVVGLSTMFLGIAMTLQPLVGTLYGENNTKAIRFLVNRERIDILAIGAICSLLILCFTSATLRVFGIESGAHAVGIPALRITCLTLALSAMLILFYINYFIIGINGLVVVISFIKDFAAPVALIILCTALSGNKPEFIWIGLALSPVSSLLITYAIILLRYGKERFPFLLSKEQDEKIHIYSFALSSNTVSQMSQTAGELLKQNGYHSKLQVIVGMCIEDLLCLVMEKNKPAKRALSAECTLILEEKGVRVILRDEGKTFTLTDADAKVDSILQYIVANELSAAQNKVYITTTGYNRNELFFEKT